MLLEFPGEHFFSLINHFVKSLGFPKQLAKLPLI